MQPRSSKNRCCGMHGGCLKIAITAPPIEGKANKALISYLAELKAAETAPFVERVYQADRVDLSIMGDFEEYEIAVGLMKERLTPPPRYRYFDDPQAQWETDKKARQEEERRKHQQAQKEKNKRKQAKKTRRGKRGKRK